MHSDHFLSDYFTPLLQVIFPVFPRIHFSADECLDPQRFPLLRMTAQSTGFAPASLPNIRQQCIFIPSPNPPQSHK